MTTDTEQFEGFPELINNYCQVPHVLFDKLPQFSTLGELAIVLYVLRHTWGYQEFDEGKRITVDEFMYGRKRRDGRRIDNGIGMSEPTIRTAIKRAIKDGFLTVEIDDSDTARVKKYYQLRMKEGERSLPPEGKLFTPRGKTSFPRTEKETKEEKLKSLQLSKDERTAYYNAVLLHQFEIRHTEGMKLAKTTAIPVSNCLTALLNEFLTLEQYLAYATEFGESNRNKLTPIQSPSKLALAVLKHSQTHAAPKRELFQPPPEQGNAPTPEQIDALIHRNKAIS